MLSMALYHYVLRLVNWMEREEGQDLIEYGLLLFLISIVAVVAITSAGTTIKGFWETIATTLSGL